MRLNQILTQLDPGAFRCENKFVMQVESDEQIISELKKHPYLFREAYPTRKIHSVYLDTPDWQFYHSNLTGIGSRMKLRLRWYDDGLKPDLPVSLEFKIKQNFYGTKLRFPMFFKDGKEQMLKRSGLEKAIQDSPGLPHWVQDYLKQLRPSLMNTYWRKYFGAYQNKFMFTIDSDMRFIDPINPKNEYKLDEEKVLELKYASKDELQGRMCYEMMPFQLSRNSKYMNGLRLTQGME